MTTHKMFGKRQYPTHPAPLEKLEIIIIIFYLWYFNIDKCDESFASLFIHILSDVFSLNYHSNTVRI